MVVDIGPGLFSTEVASRPFEEQGVEKGEESGRRLLDLRKDLGEIDRELARLKERRAELIVEKERILEEAGRAVETSFMDYRSRKIVYEYVLHPQISAKDLARGLGIRDDAVEKLIGKLEEERDAKRT
jgi:predicted transcriptional regulator